MTLLSLVPLALFIIALTALVARFTLPRLSLAAAGELAPTASAPLDPAPVAARFGPGPEKQAREPAVAAFPRAM